MAQSVYSRRHWGCKVCGRVGFVLIHEDDTPDKANWRRAQSHQAQVKPSRHRPQCAGDLRWYKPLAVPEGRP